MFVRAAEMVRRRGLFWAENDADACRSFFAVEWYYLDRLLDIERRVSQDGHHHLLRRHGLRRRCVLCQLPEILRSSEDTLLGGSRHFSHRSLAGWHAIHRHSRRSALSITGAIWKCADK